MRVSLTLRPAGPAWTVCSRVEARPGPVLLQGPFLVELAKSVVPPPRPFGGATAVRQPGLDVGRAPPLSAAHLLVQLCGLVPPLVSPARLLASCCQPLAVLALFPIHLISCGQES